MRLPFTWLCISLHISLISVGASFGLYFRLSSFASSTEDMILLTVSILNL